MKKINIPLFIFTAIMFGCGSSHEAFSSFTDVHLYENLYRVTLSNSEVKDEDKAKDLTLLRCAEISRNEGFNYFVIIDGKNVPDTNKYGQSTGGQSMYSINNYSIANPALTNLFLGFHLRPLGTSYDVEGVLFTMKKKYNIK